MTFLATGKVSYRARIARAKLLTSRYPFAGEVLSFYATLATFQSELFELLPKVWGKQSIAPAHGVLRSECHAAILVQPFGQFLSLIERQAPGPLAGQARLLHARGENTWAATLEEFWASGLRESGSDAELLEENPGEPLHEFLSRAFLQPYAEFVVSAMLPPSLLMTVCRCPRCDSLPVLGVLRPEGDGGKRFLQCAFCAQEWEFRRILCAFCGEDKEGNLPVYVAEEFPHIRTETCDTCKRYLRTIDMTKDGHAVPAVDDLGAIPLSLWAEEHGYARIQANLLGT